MILQVSSKQTFTVVHYGICGLCCPLQPRAVNVDLQTDATLQVDISDALSERDKVKFTVHTKVSCTHSTHVTVTVLVS